ncbi:MAG: hypothetical protein AB7F35_14010 [Acetobacteraceae bacterium]
MRTRLPSRTIVLGLALILGACGTQQPERTTGTAAAGAGTGALIGLVGGPVGVVVGAVVGAGAGAATGAGVGPSHINLGPPPWADGSG